MRPQLSTGHRKRLTELTWTRATLVAILSLVAVPGNALAGHSAPGIDSNCRYTQANGDENPAAVVYTQDTPDGSGMSGDVDLAAGICVDLEPGVGTGPFYIEGGALEAGAGVDQLGAGGGDGVYLVFDGDDANIDPAGQSDGYIGVSNYENAPPKDTCPTSTGGGGTNSGGCLVIPVWPLPVLPVPLIVCGNLSGPSWDATGRDGCRVDALTF